MNSILDKVDSVICEELDQLAGEFRKTRDIQCGEKMNKLITLREHVYSLWQSKETLEKKFKLAEWSCQLADEKILFRILEL